MIPKPRRRGRWELIWSIARKDLEQSWKQLVIVLLVSLAIMAFVFLTAARSPPYCYPGPCTFVWLWEPMKYVYGVAAFVTTLSVGLTFGAFYGGEIKSGTVRALILYPIDLNDLTLAKLLSTTIVGSITSAIGFLIPFAPFMAQGYFPAGGIFVIFLGALWTTLVILFVGAFLAHILAYATGRLLLTPSVVVGLMMTLAIVSTQTVLNGIGLLLLFIAAALGGGYGDPGALQSLWNVTGGVSIVSPHHATATILQGLLGPTGHFPDVYVVIPIGIALIVAGYLLARRVYLDVFIR